MSVLTFKKRELVYGAAGDAECGRGRTIERHAVQQRLHLPLRATLYPLVHPHVDRFRRNIEDPSWRSKHRGCLAIKIAARQITYSDRVQRGAVRRIERVCRAVNISSSSNAMELTRSRTLMPFAHCRKALERILGAGINIERRVEDELGADKTAGIVAR